MNPSCTEHAQHCGTICPHWFRESSSSRKSAAIFGQNPLWDTRQRWNSSSLPTFLKLAPPSMMTPTRRSLLWQPPPPLGRVETSQSNLWPTAKSPLSPCRSGSGEGARGWTIRRTRLTTDWFVLKSHYIVQGSGQLILFYYSTFFSCKTWLNAYLFCKALNRKYKLAEVKTKQQQDMITWYGKKGGWERSTKGGGLWIGGHDQVREGGDGEKSKAFGPHI